MDPYQKLIITTNNLERVREVLKTFLNELDYYKYAENADKSTKNGDVSNCTYLETLIENCCEYILQINGITLDSVITNKIDSELDPHMFYLFESPESSSAQEV